MQPIDENPRPKGELSLQTVAMPRDTNSHGDIFGGWLLLQMDTAGSITASSIAKGRVATVAVQSMSFLTPLHLGAVVSCYCEIIDIGRSSIRVHIEVWINAQYHDEKQVKVTEGEFIYVAIDAKKRTRPINPVR